MELLANDLSVHGQFHDLTGFRDALSRLMALRVAARRFGSDVQCHSRFLNAMPLPDMPMRQAIGNLGVESERRAVMAWLTRSGPFWDDMRQHEEDDWLECDGNVVTDTAVGEAAFRTLHGVECGLVSLSPSDWNSNPVDVNWKREAEGLDDRSATVGNWWNAAILEDTLQDRAPPVRSWGELHQASVKRFEGLILAANCFDPLAGVPFSNSAAARFLALLGVLDRMSRAVDATGARTEEGHLIHRRCFTGDRAWFSDSSDKEKREFRHDLTFANPDDPASSLFCTWHGKVSRSTLRLHFSWPAEAGKPVYVVYAGPKITKR